MKIIKDANQLDTNMCIIADSCGDYLPNTITIHHNGREITYTQVIDKRYKIK